MKLSISKLKTNGKKSFFFNSKKIRTEDSFSNSPTNSSLKKKKTKKIVNPMLSILFVSMAIKAWHKFYLKKVNKELNTDDSFPYVESSEESIQNEEVKEEEELWFQKKNSMNAKNSNFQANNLE